MGRVIPVHKAEGSIVNGDANNAHVVGVQHADGRREEKMSCARHDCKAFATILNTHSLVHRLQYVKKLVWSLGMKR